MKINTKEVIFDYDNKPLKDGGKDVILKDVFLVALNSALPNEDISAENKIKIFNLSLKIHKNSELDIPAEDAVFIKDRVNKIYTSSVIYGRICQVIDGTKTPKE